MDGKQTKTSESHPIRVDFLPSVPGRLGITFAPGKKSDGADGVWERDLETDLGRLVREYRVEVLVSLMERIEYPYLGIPDLFWKARDRGMEVIHFPIPDGGVPVDPEADRYEAFIKEIAERLERGRTVVVHCRGGLGRSGMVAASVLVALGRSAEEAIQTVREARKGAVETPEQHDRVRWFEMELRPEGGPGS